MEGPLEPLASNCMMSRLSASPAVLLHISPLKNRIRAGTVDSGCPRGCRRALTRPLPSHERATTLCHLTPAVRDVRVRTTLRIEYRAAPSPDTKFRVSLLREGGLRTTRLQVEVLPN